MFWNWLCGISNTKTNYLSSLWILSFVLFRSSTNFREQISRLELLKVWISGNICGHHRHLWSVGVLDSRDLRWGKLSHVGDSWYWGSREIRIFTHHHTGSSITFHRGHFWGELVAKWAAHRHRGCSFILESLISSCSAKAYTHSRGDFTCKHSSGLKLSSWLTCWLRLDLHRCWLS